MTDPHRRHCADQQWVEAMFADLQHHIDDLAGQLRTLTHLVHTHTVAALALPPDTANPPPTPPPGHGDG